MIDLTMADGTKIRRWVAVALMTAILAGCASSSGSQEDNAGRFLIAPGKFVLFNCPQLAERTTATVARLKELERLMAKAGPGPDGQLVSTVAYRPEYLSFRGDLNELRNAAAAKNCKFVPGAENPGARMSDGAVR